MRKPVPMNKKNPFAYKAKQKRKKRGGEAYRKIPSGKGGQSAEQKGVLTAVQSNTLNV